MKSAIGIERLAAQRILRPESSSPEAIVAWLGAIQAQDYGSSKWAVGVRMRSAATDAIVEQAIDRGAIVRTHAFRGTWQLIAAADVRWILSLVGPRILTRSAGRHRQLGIDAALLKKSNAAIAKALGGGVGGVQRTRAEMKAVLERARITLDGPRFSHLMFCAELDGLICSGARRGKQSTYALLDDRAPAGRTIDRAEAIAELAKRYFQSRAPATIADFVWWSGLSVREARAGFESVAPAEKTRAASARAPGAFLLPAFDEYLIAYRDRDAVLDPKFTKRIHAGTGVFQPLLVIGGRVVGIWRRTIDRKMLAIAVDTFETVKPSAIEPAARRYAEFIGVKGPCSVHTSGGGRSVVLRFLL